MHLMDWILSLLRQTRSLPSSSSGSSQPSSLLIALYRLPSSSSTALFIFFNILFVNTQLFLLVYLSKIAFLVIQDVHAFTSWRAAADQILRELQSNPDTWLQAVHILQNSQNPNTKFFTLQASDF